MCILLFQWQPETATPLILAGNRDEFYARPTEAARWRDNIFCGLDLRAGGTWLGVTRAGRFAAVTNFREPIQEPTPGMRSRGELPWGFLSGELDGELHGELHGELSEAMDGKTSADTTLGDISPESISPESYAKAVAARQADYGPFNLLVGDRDSLWYMSNRGAPPQAVAPGIHGLSNGRLDTPWPKVQRGKQLLANAIENGASEADLLALLSDRQQPSDGELPQTGVPDMLEKLVAPIFIESAQYGTRCSSLLWLPREGEPHISEHRWPTNSQKR